MKRLTYILLFALVLYLIYDYFKKKAKSEKRITVNNIYSPEIIIPNDFSILESVAKNIRDLDGKIISANDRLNNTESSVLRLNSEVANTQIYSRIENSIESFKTFISENPNYQGLFSIESIDNTEYPIVLYKIGNRIFSTSLLELDEDLNVINNN